MIPIRECSHRDLHAISVLAPLPETITKRAVHTPYKPTKLSLSPPTLPTMTVDMDDEKRAEGLASDANTMVEKFDNDAEKTDNDAEKTDVEAENDPLPAVAPAVEPADTLSADEYPKGLQFVFILLALILSIFMVALDLVCLCLVFFDRYMLILRADYRRHGHPKDHGPVPQCFPDRMVRLGILPDCCFIHLTLGQALQVFHPEMDLPCISLHL